jgi:hypothetical protein
MLHIINHHYHCCRKEVCRLIIAALHSCNTSTGNSCSECKAARMQLEHNSAAIVMSMMCYVEQQSTTLQLSNTHQLNECALLTRQSIQFISYHSCTNHGSSITTLSCAAFFKRPTFKTVHACTFFLVQIAVSRTMAATIATGKSTDLMVKEVTILIATL